MNNGIAASCGVVDEDRRLVQRGAATHRPGRPTSYKPELAETVCRLVAMGHNHRQIASMPDMPSVASIWRWQRTHAGFRCQHARAREIAAEVVAEQGFLRAMDATAETAEAARLAFDAARWLAARLDPARWGSRAEANAAARDPGAAARKAAARAEMIRALQGMAKTTE